MARIGLKLTLWRRGHDGRVSDAERIRSERTILAFLEAMVLHNVGLFEADPRLPGLYESGVRYEREEPSANVARLADAFGVQLRTPEEWLDVLEILKAGVDDCEGLSTYRAAELRARRRINASAAIRGRWIEDEQRWVYHVVVAYPNGTIEDPSARLGMLEAA